MSTLGVRNITIQEGNRRRAVGTDDRAPTWPFGVVTVLLKTFEDGDRLVFWVAGRKLLYSRLIRKTCRDGQGLDPAQR